MGTLLLRTGDSTTELSFEREKGVRRLVMEFDVQGCQLSPNARKELDAKARSVELDDSAVFGEEVIEPEGSSLYVAVPVNPEEFDAGIHTASITVGGANIASTRAKVSVQKTESPVGPTLLVLVAVLFGVVGALIVSGLPKESKGAHWLRLGGAIGLAVGAAGAVWWTSYGEAEVWEWELVKTAAPLFVGALTAAYGAASGALQTKRPSGQ